MYYTYKFKDMKILPPFNLKDWIQNNRHLLKPPVGNKNLYVDAGDFIVMIVAGPNARKDYHYNETEELFYQIEGDIVVKTQQKTKMVEVKIKEGISQVAISLVVFYIIVLFLDFHKSLYCKFLIL